MYRKLAAIANLRTASAPRSSSTSGGLLRKTGAAELGVQRYLDAVETPPSEDLLMMGEPEVAADEYAEPAKEIPTTITDNALDGMFSSAGGSPGGSQAPMSEAVSATGSKATSSAKGGVKNASFMEGGILPAALGGIGGYIVGEHFIAPHFARQQAAIAEQIAQGQSAMATAARNQRISPILAAAAGALLLSWLLSDSAKKKQEVRDSMGGAGNYAAGLQGFDPYERVPLMPAPNRPVGY